MSTRRHRSVSLLFLLTVGIGLTFAPPSRAGNGPSGPAAPPDSLGVRHATDPERIAEHTVVSTAWTFRRGSAVVILDARADAAAYARGHLPGAAHVPVAAVRASRGGRTDLRSAPELRRVFGAACVAGDSEVVVYADERLHDATQVLLALATLGHRRAAVLEGGLRAWVAEGRALATDVPRPSDRAYPERPAPDLVVGAREVWKASRAGRPVVLDVRPAAAARSGHVPGARNRPSSEDSVEGADGVFWRSRAALEAAYAAAGVPATGDVVVCCGTGLHATQTWFTLKVLLGRTGVRWYDGSFEDWAQRRELPVETGSVQAAAR